LSAALDRVRGSQEEEVTARKKLTTAVDDAREVGATWEQIGDALGTTKQSAWETFGQGAKRRARWSAPHGESELAVALRGRGLDVTRQLRAGSYRIDVACWPVAYEVWNSNSRPHGTPDQSKRITALILWGWSVCYWKIHREATVPDALVELLDDYRRLVLGMHAPPYVMLRNTEVVTEGWVNDGHLELVCWPDAEWRAFVASRAVTQNS
jgi:hypothetical protein